MDCFLGVELGTTNIKLGIFSIEGKLLKWATRQLRVEIGKNDGKATENPANWWENVCDMLREVAPIFKDHTLKGIAVGSNGPTVVNLDKNFNPVHPSILWMDRRAHKQADFIAEKLGHKSNDLAWYVPRVLWLKENHPESFAKIKHLCQPLDYINCKLTGNITASLCSDEIMPWKSDMIDAAGLDHNLFADYKKMGECVGYVTRKVATETGLPFNVPVFAGTGGADFVEELIGVGVLKNGMICDRGGTSQGVEFCWNTPGDKYKLFSAKHPIVKNSYHIAGLMPTTGKSIQWFKETYYTKKKSYNGLFKDVAKSSPGANKLIFLPSLMGNRTPWWDVNARGVFIGITLSHKKEDFLRSLLEGTAFGINQIINIFKADGGKPTEIRTCGIQSKSSQWNQIKADITGLPVKTTSLEDTSILGMAIIAGNGAGTFKNIEKTAEKFVKIKKVFHPNTANTAIYKQMQDVYDDLYPSLKNSFEKLSH